MPPSGVPPSGPPTQLTPFTVQQPLLQNCPALKSHMFPQRPQLKESKLTLVQNDPQHCSPGKHIIPPQNTAQCGRLPAVSAWHISPAAVLQTLPQNPQLLGSEAVLTQVVLLQQVMRQLWPPQVVMWQLPPTHCCPE